MPLPRTPANELYVAQWLWDSAEFEEADAGSRPAPSWLKDIARFLKGEPLENADFAAAFPDQESHEAPTVPPEAPTSPTLWQRPFDGMVLTQGFSQAHQAEDYVSSVEHRPTIVCPHPGIVAWVGWDARPELAQHPEWDRGLYVRIEHVDGYMTEWCHLSGSYPMTGDVLPVGGIIGFMGNSGFVRATPPGDGTHVHLNCYDSNGVRVPFSSLL